MDRKSIGEVLENPKDDEFYILTTRHYPQKLRYNGLSLDDEENPIDKWDKCIAPSKRLIDDWRNDRISWDEYVERYIDEKTETFITGKKRMYGLQAGEKEPVLVCVEGEEKYPHCHTWIILEEVD